jgi:wobble nucleotide-excising tRNase
MPLKKIISIKNVGRLVNCAQKGPEFNKYNVIFAENGRGKTTLCAVLRSLQTGEHEHVTERKTIAPVTAEPSATVRLDGGNATYDQKNWSEKLPEIAIFDATFVARNVHAGEYVSRDHRSNLLQVIVGEAGIALAEAVSKFDNAIREKNGELTRSRRVVQTHLPAGANLEAFLELDADPDINAKIAAKTTEHGAAKRAEEIKNRAALSAAAVPAIPAELATILGKTLENVSADAEKLLREHVASHQMHEQGEAWISQGLSYLTHETCPYCGQGVQGLPLIEAYKQFFSDAYNALIVEISKLQSQTETALGNVAVATLGRTFATNDAGVQFWKQFTTVTVETPDHDSALAVPARKLLEAALALIDAKMASPLTAIAPDKAFEDAVKSFTVTVTLLGTYNASVDTANVAIAAQKKQAQGASVLAIEKELEGLNLVKIRKDPKIVPLCTECKTLAADKAKLDTDKDVAKAALDKHADAMIHDYETTINQLLKGFGAGFTIANTKKTYLGGTPTSVYQILINNQAVDLGDITTPPGQPCFRTTLSAGDKSTLALAFFLAQLDHDPNKAKKVVVFDDPFNSQDRSRRERTAELLRKYGKECAQLILLSHDPFFLELVYSKLPKSERHSVQLSRAPGNATTMEEWDVEKETQEGYFKDHAVLSSYLLSGGKDLIDIARKIRPVLEGYHRYRFPHQFPDNEWLGDMIKRIRDSAGAHPMFPALGELESINDYSKKYHHQTNPGKADNEPINDGELQGYAKRTLAIVGGY